MLTRLENLEHEEPLLAMRLVEQYFGARPAPGTAGAYRVFIRNLRVARGEFAVVRGPNGSGKSTLMALASLMQRPSTAGQFELFGVDIAAAWQQGDAALCGLRARAIGYVPQKPCLLASHTVRENVVLRCRLNGERVDAAWIEHLVEGLGCRDQSNPSDLRRIWNHDVLQISGGQTARTNLAQQLACRPALLLADEITASLDPHTARSTIAFLDELRRTDGLTIVAVTQQPEFFQEYATQIIQMETSRAGVGLIAHIDRPHAAPVTSESSVYRQSLIETRNGAPS